MSLVHPQEHRDRQLVNQLLSSEPEDRHLVELARLTIRYQGFDGAEDIQSQLKDLMARWGYSEETLFAWETPVYRGDSSRQDDWA
jgi:Protein of unknown function (DUF3288)